MMETNGQSVLLKMSTFPIYHHLVVSPSVLPLELDGTDHPDDSQSLSNSHLLSTPLTSLHPAEATLLLQPVVRLLPRPNFFLLLLEMQLLHAHENKEVNKNSNF